MDFYSIQKGQWFSNCFYYPLQHLSNYGVSKLYIEDHKLFNIPLKYEKKQIIDLALNHELQIDGPAKWEAISELVEDLGQVDAGFFKQRVKEFFGIWKNRKGFRRNR
ncbi:hypothetical protein [Desulfoscipio geothermicus]|uniref:Uncharacterized protein n=1 Tax=Desulfoscipio geothermicus DSM 3669 TaxID=1121426 RepID=A0A1I6DXD7_9FIRM|nr:hypothetical protein [Desulfoscipio geothermicus]SFR10174.1 hypothetical protein SAMN05660706_12053 [Desulfoscipio geothermicus DSM 3669]